MRKNENGLQWIVTETAQKKLHFPWGAWVVCAVLTVGFCLLLTAAFPSVPYYGIVILLRKLRECGIFTEKELRKIAARIAADNGVEVMFFL